MFKSDILIAKAPEKCNNNRSERQAPLKKRRINAPYYRLMNQSPMVQHKRREGIIKTDTKVDCENNANAYVLCVVKQCHIQLFFPQRNKIFVLASVPRFCNKLVISKKEIEVALSALRTSFFVQSSKKY